MKTIVISIAIFVIALLTPSTAQVEIPKCIQNMIDSMHATPRWSPYTSIDSYVYRGKLTYLAASSCCDRMNPLFDGECNRICAPSGGFIGIGDGKCKDFGETAKLLGNIWVAPRGK
ncbi:unnamed protein product [Rotaria sp. Silwood2]|nr:unnamed protein product [Rotaria sp. Silwood2]CAF3427318.1 unnamed protein product [Rotaria sp. Silwood2]CAF3954289.1 unnamed protein product [Rotaria sp. Silwood2]CAF3994044.1 unnamed protein product [Rotaria sp. Silwood2]CAF4516638.1 unnamed protein product [Rotaria sp. Silwood2]